MALVLALTALGCSMAPSDTCGAGTQLVGSVCVAVPSDAGGSSCGPGTVSVGGVCTAIDAGSVRCGSGTTLVGDQCVADAVDGGPVVTCGPGTLLVGGVCMALDAGTETCGPGTIDDGGVCVPVMPCAAPIACPAPSAGHASICGRVFDLEDTSAVSVALAVSLFDAVAFAASPSTAAPLATTSADACGRFALADAAVPTSGSVVIVVDDPASSADDRALTATGFLQVTSGLTVADVVAWSLRRATDAAWSAASGLGPPTLSGRGVWIGLFVDPTAPASYPFAGAPRAGVTATRAGAPVPADDLYFSDTSALARAMLSPGSSATGANGTALLGGSSSIDSFSGQGGEPSGCTWPSALAAAPAGVALVQTIVAGCS